MDKQANNIDQLVQEKFENFAPIPPAHIWEGVQSGIAAQTTTSIFGSFRTRVAAAVIFILASIGLWWFLPSDSGIDKEMSSQDVKVSTSSENSTINNVVETDLETGQVVDNSTSNINAGNDSEINIDKNSDIESSTNSAVVNSTITSDNETSTTINEPKNATTKSDYYYKASNDSKHLNDGTNYQNEPYLANINTILALDAALNTETDASIKNHYSDLPDLPRLRPETKNNNWAHGIYFTPEIMLNDFDSVQLLPSYALNYEPSYHFNDHWFIRFGIGATYQRERGFAKLDYISNEKIGTYEQVIEVTFDSVGNDVVPTYHTKTTEVWDSVRHLQVTEVTNRYVYIQTPLLFGYYKKERKFNWFVYGGPAFNLMISKWIEEPQDGVDMVEIVDLENNLPERSPYYMQLWVGAGIEYKIGKQLAIAFEPNYRYYFNDVYKEDKYKTALSSFSLRFGVVFTVK